MLLLGLISLVQAYFLPGYVALRCLKIPAGLRRTIVISFGLSLVINHAIVVGLVCLGGFRPTTMYAVTALELGIIGLFAWRDTRHGQPTGPDLPTDADNRWPLSPSAQLSLIALAAIFAGWCMYSVFRASWVFCEWDAVASWNRWATEWASGIFPIAPGLYPQLVPTSISLSYVYMDDAAISMFPKFGMSFYVLWMLLAAIELVCETGEALYGWWGVATQLLMTLVLRARYLGSGYVDGPLACFAFVAVGMLIFASCQNKPELRVKYIFLGAIFSAGAALTKHSGLYLVAIFPVLAGFLAWRQRDSQQTSSSRGSRWRICISAGLAACAVALPWFAFKHFEFSKGLDVDNLKNLASLSSGQRSVVDQIFYAVKMLRDSTGTAWLLFFAICCAIGCADGRARILTILVALPLSAAWALGAAYDTRNLAPAIPLFAMAAAAGWTKLGSPLTERFNRRQTDRVWKIFAPSASQIKLVFGVIAVVAVFGNFAISSEAIKRKQVSLQRQIGEPAINQVLYDYFANCPRAEKVVTDYTMLHYLPGLEHTYQAFYDADFARLLAAVDTKFVLIHKIHSPRVGEALAAASKAGKLQLRTTGFCFELYEKPNSDGPLRESAPTTTTASAAESTTR